MGLVCRASLPCVLWGGRVVGCALAVVNPWWLNLYRVVEGVVLNRRAAPIFFLFWACALFHKRLFYGRLFFRALRNSSVIGALFA